MIAGKTETRYLLKTYRNLDILRVINLPKILRGKDNHTRHDHGADSVANRSQTVRIMETRLLNRVTHLTALPWESQLLLRFLRKRIEAFTCYTG